MLSNDSKDLLIKMQRGEATEYLVYKKLAKKSKGKNKKVFLEIANDEKKHYEILKSYTNLDIKPNKFKFMFHWIIATILGVTFGVRLMEVSEKKAQIIYSTLIEEFPEIVTFIEDEHKHENELLEIIDERKIIYISSMVLGLNDALVEISGALAGFAFAISSSKLIAVIGLITGISATASMASSEYLSAKTDGDDHPLKASAYTGATYAVTVLLLILPYFFFSPKMALLVMLGIDVVIITVFNFYVSVVQSISFKKRFFEMFFLSFGVMALSFLIGIFVRTYFGIDI
ncbi:VIT1/CCC1 family protein [Mycoplasmatota bacterium WC44]